MQRLTRVHTGLIVLVIVTILLAACGGNARPDQGAIAAAVEATLTALPPPTKEEATPTPEPPSCLDRPDSQQWLQDVGALLDVWRDEVELVMQASRITAAEASREMRNARRQLRQMDTPTCLVPVRDQLLYQMTGGLTSLDAWIRENGDGSVFAAVANLRLDDFLAAAADDALTNSCEVELDAEWVSETKTLLSSWELKARFLTVEESRAEAQRIADVVMNDVSSNCAKASVLQPLLVWWIGIQTRLDALRNRGEFVAPNLEELDDIFVALAEEYQELHLAK